MSSLLDEALKEKYRTNAINDPLAFAKDAVDIHFSLVVSQCDGMIL